MGPICGSSWIFTEWGMQQLRDADPGQIAVPGGVALTAKQEAEDHLYRAALGDRVGL